MGVIGQIREKFPTLLLILVGGAMLAFILGDFLGQGSGLFNGNRNTVAVVEGKEITYPEFQNEVQAATQRYKQSQQDDHITSEITQQIRTSVWQKMLNDILLGDQLKPLGIIVTPDELFDMVQGNNPPEIIKRNFTDPNTGEFKRENVVNFLKNIDQQPTQVQQQWFAIEKGLREQRRDNKYYQMVASGIYTTSLEAKSQLQDQQKHYNVSFVSASYNSIPDDKISVSSNDFKKYYRTHKYLYKQDPGRNIEYITYLIKPSEKDKQSVLDETNRIKQRFEKTKRDSDFVNLNSDQPFDATFYAKGTSLPSKLDTLFFNDKVQKDSIIGPYIENKAFHLAKISQIKYAPDSVHAEHILIRIGEPKENGETQVDPQKDSTAKAKANQIEQEIKNGGDFAKLAQKYSEDPGSAVKGGDIGWFTEGQMVPTFDEFCFTHKAGDIGVVKSQFGYHIIKVIETTAPIKKVQVAQISKRIAAGNKTYEKTFNKASTFSINNTSIDAFEKSAKEKGKEIINADIKPNSITVNDLESPSDLIKWAYNSSEGKVSEPFRFGNTIVVAVIKEIREEKYSPLERVKSEVKQAVIQDKKAKILIDKMKGISNLQSLAKKVGTTVRDAKNVTFSSFSIEGMGHEPMVQGNIVTMKKGETSDPIEGNAGVYIVHINEIQKQEQPDNNLAEIQKRIAAQESRNVSTTVFDALKEKADIVDHRNKFY